MKPANRITSLKPYVFASLHKKIAAMTAQGKDVIRLDMGSPDLPPADFIVQVMEHSADRPNHHGYTTHQINRQFRQAAATYYGRRFGIELDPDSEILGLLGSKEGIFNINLAMLNPGDLVLVPDPGYPVYRTAAQIAGGEVVTLPLVAENDYLPDLPAVPEQVLARTAILWLNYPNNPTTAVAPPEFFRQAVSLAHRYDFLICHDAPYTEIAYDGYKATSLLEVPGAREVAVEFNSLSKSYNMGGWRVGMLCGNRVAVEALGTLKSNIDSNHFHAILEGGIAALTGDQSWLQERNAIYKERRDIVLDGLARAGLSARTPQGTIYVWAQVPPGESSTAFTGRMLEEIHVSMTGGTAFGQHGEGYVRISLGVATERIREAMERMVEWSGKKEAGRGKGED